MARSSRTGGTAAGDGEGGAPVAERIIDIDVTTEMRESFLEYAYSVIHTRALPDARDGLKPVQRRILFRMSRMGLRPDTSYVKCARVIGDVMGTLHPHGDGAIYDALARMAQSWSLRLPLVDPHGNFGSPDDGPAAYRYTECRLAQSAMVMTDGLDQDVVDFVPNYDGQETQPAVLPSGIPNLLVNGASGIAVGMATNIPPHNLVEVVAAARHRLASPQCSLTELMRFLPGPDLPTGGRIVGLEGIREAYATGRGTFRIRATTSVEQITARRRGIVVTELPLGVGPDRVKTRIAELVRAGKISGISDVEDHGEDGRTRVVVEIRSGFDPAAVLEELHRLTPLEETFGINAVALVEGKPQTLGLLAMLDVFLDHRLSVVARRSAFQRARADERLHLVEGFLRATLDIDDVIAVIRGSDDTATARTRLMSAFDLTRVQTDAVLELPLRRLTRLATLELETERDALTATIAELDALLGDESLRRDVVADELLAVAEAHGTPRRTVLVDAAAPVGRPGARTAGTTALELTDDPCRVLLSATGLLARVPGAGRLQSGGRQSGAGGAGRRVRHDALAGLVEATTRGSVGLVTSAGRVHRLGVVDLPALPPTASAPALGGGVPATEMVALADGEHPLALVTLATDGDPAAGGLFLATAGGVVKRVAPERVGDRDSWEVIALREGDAVVAAAVSDPADTDSEVVLVTSDAQLLRFAVGAVRAQGRGAAGMAGIRLADGARVVSGALIGPTDLPLAEVLTVSGPAPARRRGRPVAAGGAYAAVTGSVKVTALAEYPGKGRGTGGVRCHRLGGGDELLLAAVAVPPLRAVSASGVPVAIPDSAPGRRDGAGVPLGTGIAAVAGELPVPLGAPVAGPVAGSVGEPVPGGPDEVDDVTTDDQGTLL